MEGAGRSGGGSVLNCGKNTNVSFMLEPSFQHLIDVGQLLFGDRAEGSAGWLLLEGAN
jgi:hypothetical protein